jgi:hypothetical protein
MWVMTVLVLPSWFYVMVNAYDDEFKLSSVPKSGLYVIEGSKSKHELLRRALDGRGWRELQNKQPTRHRSESASYGFKWTWSQNRLQAPSNRTLLNHFANYSSFCTKTGLLTSLRARHGVDMDTFVPRSYLSPAELPEWETDYRETQAHCNVSDSNGAQPRIDCGTVAGGSLWIAKPGSGTRGVGIAVFDQVRDTIYTLSFRVTFVSPD